MDTNSSTLKLIPSSQSSHSTRLNVTRSWISIRSMPEPAYDMMMFTYNSKYTHIETIVLNDTVSKQD